MKGLYLLLVILICSLSINAQSLSGKITDSVNTQVVTGALIYIPQLNLVTSSDANGNYNFSPLPKGSYLVEVKILGYATATKQITIQNSQTIQNFALTVSTSGLQEVVVTGLGNVTSTQRSPIPVTMVTNDAILQETSTNAVDEIALEPGVTEETYGPGISKPEVNGLGFFRVLTLFDDVRQQDFQFGNEHSIMIDDYAVYNAEIIRGASSLQYGSDAVGGVVSFKSEPFPENGTIAGSVLTEYQTNNGLIGTSADIGGNNNGFIWDVRISQSEAHCYSDPKDGYVWGSAFNNDNVRATLGLEKKWGYSRLTVSLFHQNNEIAEGNRDSSGKFIFDYPINGQTEPNRSNFFSYNATSVLYQQIEHDMVSWQNSINVGQGRIIAEVAYSQDHRAVTDSGAVPYLNMWLSDIPYSLKYQIEGNNSGLKLTAGVNGFYEGMHNNIEAPEPYWSKFIIPDYNQFDIGGYAILEKDFKNLTIIGGLRYDSRNQTVDGLYDLYNETSSQTLVPEGTPNANTLFSPAKFSFNGVSGSLGATYQLPSNNYIKLNLAKSYRAPDIAELEEHRVDPSLNAYAIGLEANTTSPVSPSSESGYEADLAFGSNGKDVSFEADGFYNYIQNFIYTAFLTSKLGGDSLHKSSGVFYPVFKYEQATAEIYGVAAYFNIHPADTKWVEWDNGFTYIYSYLPNQTFATDHVPQTPAPRLTSEVKLKITNSHKILSNSYFKFGLEKDWAQNNIYSQAFTELPSSAYILCNAGVGTDIVERKNLPNGSIWERTLCSFYININNLTNVAYVDHLSFLQYQNELNGIPQRVTQPSQGIYNMGRNIGFKLIIPIGGGHRNNV